MPKLKASSGARKRFRATASGKIKYKRANHSHILTKKTSKRKRKLRRGSLIHPSEARSVRQMLPYL